MACQPGWPLGAAAAPGLPAWTESRVTATYSSAWQGAVKLSSDAYPASHSAAPIGSAMPAAARFAAAAASRRCSAVVPVLLGWVPMAKMTCRRPPRSYSPD
jgi:hypothetical protein